MALLQREPNISRSENCFRVSPVFSSCEDFSRRDESFSTVLFQNYEVEVNFQQIVCMAIIITREQLKSTWDRCFLFGTYLHAACVVFSLRMQDIRNLEKQRTRSIDFFLQEHKWEQTSKQEKFDLVYQPANFL